MTTILEKTAGLVAFVRTVDAGSFHAASRLVGSSPSAVSKSVARLERRLGVRLIQRSTRRLALTSEGLAYYERVAPLLRALDDAEDIVQMADTARGLLRVTASVELGRGLIASWAQRAARYGRRRRHPASGAGRSRHRASDAVCRAGRSRHRPSGPHSARGGDADYAGAHRPCVWATATGPRPAVRRVPGGPDGGADAIGRELRGKDSGASSMAMR